MTLYSRRRTDVLNIFNQLTSFLGQMLVVKDAKLLGENLDKIRLKSQQILEQIVVVIRFKTFKEAIKPLRVTDNINFLTREPR
jgi:hypothetical protein